MSPSTHSTSGASAASTGSISPRPNAPYSFWICSRLDTWGTLSPRCRLARHATCRQAPTSLLLTWDCGTLQRSFGRPPGVGSRARFSRPAASSLGVGAPGHYRWLGRPMADVNRIGALGMVAPWPTLGGVLRPALPAVVLTALVAAAGCDSGSGEEGATTERPGEAESRGDSRTAAL